MSQGARLAASFRDPSGHVFRRDGVLYRQVNRSYSEHLERLFGSGLHDELTGAGLLIPIEERLGSEDLEAVAILRPERVATISYPYEWCFGQLKDAALLTLEIARRALEKGMVLKDASAYNVQFHRGRPILIDTLSFETYQEGEPWIAYRQFCGHFLAPLALMALVDVRLGGLLRVHLDGIPLDLASHLLPGATRLTKPGLAMHIHLHGRATNERATEAVKKPPHFSKLNFLAQLDSLKGTVEGLRWEPKGTQWAEYYSETNYTDAAMSEKRRLVAAYLDGVQGTCWDLGANTGEFSALAAEKGLDTVAWDIDPGAVERAYAAKRPGVLPLLQDLTNPSPGLGWAGAERDSLEARGPVDMVMALALVHHLAIGNNVPLPDVAAYLARLGERAIVEWVPKEDSQVRRLLASRRDVFPTYSQDGFEAAFSVPFEIEAKSGIAGTERTLYRLRRR